MTDKLIDQVTDHVYRIDMEGMNVFLIVLPESLTLIDTSFPGTSARIFEAVRLIGRDPEEQGIYAGLNHGEAVRLR